MIIKKFNQLNPDILSKQFSFFTLIVGKKSSDMFDYFGVEEMHGLKKSECYDKPGDCYIAGFCNVYPDDSSKHYLFLNSFRFNKTYLDYLLIMHECSHLSLEKHGRNLEDGQVEEDMVTWSEETAIDIIEFLKSNGIL